MITIVAVALVVMLFPPVFRVAIRGRWFGWCCTLFFVWATGDWSRQCWRDTRALFR